MTDPASSKPARHASAVQAVETIGSVLTDLVEIAEQLPVELERAETAARILDRLSEELAEAASMLRAELDDAQTGADDQPAAAAELSRLRSAFPRWTIGWIPGPDFAGYTASRQGFPRICSPTAPMLAARIFDQEGTPR
jgi:hypothetical protein